MSRKFKVSGGGGLPNIPPGEYPATFSGWEEITTRFGNPVKLKFTISEGECAGTEVSDLAREHLTPKTKFGRYVSVLLGEPLKMDTELDLDALVGTPCIVVVETVQGTLGAFSKVVDVKPAK